MSLACSTEKEEQGEWHRQGQSLGQGLNKKVLTGWAMGYQWQVRTWGIDLMEVNYKKRPQTAVWETDCTSKGEEQGGQQHGVDQVAGSTVWKRPLVPGIGKRS